MGQIKIKFFANGKDIFQEPVQNDKIAKAQYFQRKYCINKIEQIEVANDTTLELDIDTLQKEIKWDSFEMLSPITIENIEEIGYYHETYLQLEGIINELEHCRFEDRYKIRDLGEKAIRIISNIKKSKFNTKLTLDEDIASDRLMYTVNQKEVNLLLEYVKPRDSKKIKETALNDAIRQVVHEIKLVSMYLAEYN